MLVTIDVGDVRLIERYWQGLAATAAIAIAVACGAAKGAAPVKSATVERSAQAVLGSGFLDKSATVNGIRLHYVIGGKGPPLLLVPGWPETWMAWRRVMPELAKTYTVIAVDTRGMGSSERPTSGYDMTTVASDLLSLMNQAGYRRFRIVGHDIGVWISYAIVVDHPEAIERAAMVDSNIPGVSPPVELFLSKVDNTHSWHFMFNQLDELPEILTKGREPEFLTWLYAHYAFDPKKLAIDDYIRAYSAPGAMTAGFAYYRALPETIEQNRRRMRSRIKMPILAIGGDHGTADKAEATLRPYVDHLRGAVLPNCGHYVPEECAEELLEPLVPFLAGKDVAK